MHSHVAYECTYGEGVRRSDRGKEGMKHACFICRSIVSTRGILKQCCFIAQHLSVLKSAFPIDEGKEYVLLAKRPDSGPEGKIEL